MNNEIKGLRMIITIVDRGKGKKVTKLMETFGCVNHQIFLGHGTAPDEMLQYLGLSTIEKDVLISIVDVDILPHLFATLNDEMKFSLPGNGIACSIPIQSVAGKTTIDEILGFSHQERSSKQ